MAHRWTPAEINYLHELAGDMSRHQLVIAYNEWAAANGYQQRTPKSIYVKAAKLGISLTAIGEVLTTGGIAKTLCINDTTVQGWMVRYPDLPRKRYGTRYYIRRTSLLTWAKQHPHLFGGLQRSALVQLLNSEQFADYITEHYPSRPVGLEKTAIRIKCIDTGRIYPSISAAARDAFVTYQALSKGITEDRPVCGRHYCLIHDPI